MRILVSGTHGMGKTTFIRDFVEKYPNYVFDEEPYYKIMDLGHIDPMVGLSLDQCLIQFKYSIEQLESYENENNLILDRCPIDFIAYGLCAAKEEDIDIRETEFADYFDEVKELLTTFDLISFIPITTEYPILFTQENPNYRTQADINFKKLYRSDIYELLPNYAKPRIIELIGSREKRIQQIECYL